MRKNMHAKLLEIIFLLLVLIRNQSKQVKKNNNNKETKILLSILNLMEYSSSSYNPLILYSVLALNFLLNLPTKATTLFI